MVHQTGTKEKIDLMFIILKQIDRINEIISQENINLNQLARSIDGLRNTAYPLISEKFNDVEIVSKNLTHEDYYSKCLEKYKNIMTALEKGGHLFTKTYISDY